MFIELFRQIIFQSFIPEDS